MHCPFCAAEDTRVVDSRLTAEGAQVRRRRECTACNERFSTLEAAALSLPRILKGDGRPEEFDENKLRNGLERALRKRPVSTERVDTVVSRIKYRLRTQGEREVPSRQVGELVMEELRTLDMVAYLRFASVYRSFEDLKDFLEEIARIESSPDPELKKAQLPLIGETGNSDEP